MFLGGFRESTQSVVPIEETDFDTFILLLYFIYNNGNLKKLIQSKEMTKASSSHGGLYSIHFEIHSFIHSKNSHSFRKWIFSIDIVCCLVENRVVSLLITAHKYQFDVLVNECEEYLISQISKMEVKTCFLSFLFIFLSSWLKTKYFIKMEDIISLLVIADTYHASKLKNSCLEYASCYLTDFNVMWVLFMFSFWKRSQLHWFSICFFNSFLDFEFKWWSEETNRWKSSSVWIETLESECTRFEWEKWRR